MVQDVTDRRRLETSLRTLPAVAEHSNDFIGLCTPDMTPFFLSAAGRRMVGLGDRDVSQTRLLDYFWPEDRARIEAEAIPALVRDGRWSGEVRFRHFETGAPIHTIWSPFVIRDELGRPLAWATISPNLDEIKRAAETAKRQAALLDLAHDAIFVRGAGDKVTYWNRGAEVTYGWSDAEALGRVTHDLLRTRFPCSLAEVRRALQERGSWEGELVHTRKDGREIVVASRWAAPSTARKTATARSSHLLARTGRRVSPGDLVVLHRESPRVRAAVVNRNTRVTPALRRDRRHARRARTQDQ